MHDLLWQISETSNDIIPGIMVNDAIINNNTNITSDHIQSEN